MSSGLQTIGQQRRIIGLALVLGAAGLALLGRLVWWQLVPHEDITSLALVGAERVNRILAARGNILDANGHYLVASTVEYSLSVSPRLLTDNDREKLAPILAGILGQSEEEVLEVLLQSDAEYAPLAARLPASAGRRIEDLRQDGDLNLDAFRLEPRFKRLYPDGELAAHLLGFVDHQEHGQYGLEQYYDTPLRGIDGNWRGISDSWGEQIQVSLGGYQPAKDGKDLVLTLDRNIQYQAERILREGMGHNEATAGNIIVVDPKTGAVLAMASLPSYKPDEYGWVDTKNRYINTATSALYEPGSVFKVLTLAAALEARVIRPTDTYDDRGEIIVGQQTIYNSDRMAHGRTTMTELLAYSRNVGAAHVAALLGATRFYEAIRRLGFAETTGVDLGREEKGIMRVPTDPYWHMSDLGTNSYGQGIAVTPLQLAMAYAAIANDGVLMRPYIVSRIVGGDSVEEQGPFPVRRVMSVEVARQMTRMMVDAVQLGMKKATLLGYRLAGKSGTSGIPDQEGYRSRDTIASFVGLGPVPDARFVILVKYEKPREGSWGLDVAAPAFREMAEFLVDYYGIPPGYH